MSSDQVNKFFNEVPNTAAPPVKEVVDVPPNYTDVSKLLDDVAYNENIQLKMMYKSGNVIGKQKIKNSEDLLELLSRCYMEALRKHIEETIKSEEERSKALVAASNYHKLLVQTISLSKDLNFNIDHNSVLAIINGAVTELTRKNLDK